jgi:hypothetical protein
LSIQKNPDFKGKNSGKQVTMAPVNYGESEVSGLPLCQFAMPAFDKVSDIKGVPL